MPAPIPQVDAGHCNLALAFPSPSPSYWAPSLGHLRAPGCEILDEPDPPHTWNSAEICSGAALAIKTPALLRHIGPYLCYLSVPQDAYDKLDRANDDYNKAQ